MTNTTTTNPSDPVFYGNEVKAKDLETINKHLKDLVKQNDWQDAMTAFICLNLRGKLMRAYGIALALVHGDKRIKKEGKTNQKLLRAFMHELGVSKSEGYDLKRVGEVLVTLMEDPILWHQFTKNHLPKTAIFRLSALKDASDKYQESGKKNADKKSFMKEVQTMHSKTREAIEKRKPRTGKTGHTR